MNIFILYDFFKLLHSENLRANPYTPYFNVFNTFIYAYINKLPLHASPSHTFVESSSRHRLEFLKAIQNIARLIFRVRCHMMQFFNISISYSKSKYFDSLFSQCSCFRSGVPTIGKPISYKKYRLRCSWSGVSQDFLDVYNVKRVILLIISSLYLYISPLKRKGVFTKAGSWLCKDINCLSCPSALPRPNT